MNNFQQNGASARDLGAYDYGSIMHYGPNGFRIGRAADHHLAATDRAAQRAE